MLKDPAKTKNEIVEWIRNYFEENGKGCKAVIGISGGKDSSIAAALCAEALGKDKVIFKEQDAAGELSTCTIIVDGFLAENVDLILANAVGYVDSANGGSWTLKHGTIGIRAASRS